MCLALYKPAGVKIDELALENGFDNNSDGAGFTIRRNGRLETYKGFMKFKDFISYWRNYKEYEAMIHFRWMTSGKKNKDNCHPFRFGAKGSRWSMIHNGVLDTRTTATMSDTACFAVDVLHELAIRNMIHHEDVVEELENEIGSGNKMVLMPPQGQAIILNEEKGFWEKDIWWSNESFKRTLYRGYYSNSSSYAGESCTSAAFNSRTNGDGWWDISDDEYHQWKQLNAHDNTSLIKCDGETEQDDATEYMDYLEKKWLESVTEADGSVPASTTTLAKTGTYSTHD